MSGAASFRRSPNIGSRRARRRTRDVTIETSSAPLARSMTT
jgi:hypothetical protein